jgi:D(-)-tartrate dehydratase
MRAFVNLGFTHAKMKIGADALNQDLRRIQAAASALGGSKRLAVDAIYRYDLAGGIAAASALAPFALWWFEDICDPLDFATQAHVAALYEPPIATGEALFSLAEAKLLDAYGGLRKERDVLEFDPVHCYGLPGYLKILDYLSRKGWPRHAFWPHGGHLFSLHLVAALGLGGVEVSPFAFAPFCGLADATQITAVRALICQTRRASALS